MEAILDIFFKHSATVIKKPKLNAGGGVIGASSQHEIKCKISSKSIDKRDKFASSVDYNAVMDTYADVDIAIGDRVVNNHNNTLFTVIEIHDAMLKTSEYKKVILKWLV